MTPFMHRFHACTGHETAPIHAFVSGSGLNPISLHRFHACFKALRQHRFTPLSQAVKDHPAFIARDAPFSCLQSRAIYRGQSCQTLRHDFKISMLLGRVVITSYAHPDWQRSTNFCSRTIWVIPRLATA